jgi:hypothetical protein
MGNRDYTTCTSWARGTVVTAHGVTRSEPAGTVPSLDSIPHHPPPRSLMGERSDTKTGTKMLKPHGRKSPRHHVHELFAGRNMKNP